MGNGVLVFFSISVVEFIFIYGTLVCFVLLCYFFNVYFIILAVCNSNGIFSLCE